MTPFETAVRIGEDAGLKLEIVGGISTWEASPSFRHQRESFRIQSSIRPPANDEAVAPCQCVHAADVYVRFADGSLKRPDIAIFCATPDEENEAITLLPEAIVEIISVGYEAKDLSVGVPFYLSAGVKDVLVLDPSTNTVRHFRPNAAEMQYPSPTRFALSCGCEVTV